MEFDVRKVPNIKKEGRDRGSTRKRIRISATPDEKYPHNLTFYLDPPTDSISLQEFEEYALARLTLLRVIERVNLTSKTKYSKDWAEDIQHELKKNQLNHFLAVATDGSHGLTDKTNEEILLCRKYDHISHFILRLAYCRSEQLRKWFLQMEVDFFRYKFHSVSDFSRDEFLELNNIHFEKVSKETLKVIEKELAASSNRISKGTVAGMDYYRVPFQLVLDLVRTRRVFLKGGMAYVPYTELIAILASQFRKTLSHCIALTKKAIPEIEQDERLSQILTDFDRRYTGKAYETKKGESLSLQDLPDKATNSFPLCMKVLYDVVEKEHHLKHFGRLQLGLFLKGIGLPLEEATKFWRSNFTKKAGMDGNRFDKQYLYNIRHMYGKEGKRADYTPYSCIKIITSSVGTGDHHGCPFRHSDALPLRSRLQSAKIPDEGVNEILKLVQENHFQLACQKYFEYTHDKVSVDGGIHHPNQYFEESENVYLGHARKTRVAVPSTKVNVYAAETKTSAEEEEWVALLQEGPSCEMDSNRIEGEGVSEVGEIPATHAIN